MGEQPLIQHVNPEGTAAPRGYSHVVTTTGGKTVFISGQIALDADGEIVGEGDFAAQAEQVFQNLGAALAAAGGDFGHVVKLGFFFVNISQIQAARDVRDGYIDVANPPASTAVEVSRLIRPELLIEVDAIAVVPE